MSLTEQRYHTLKAVQPIRTFATIAKNSDWSSQWSSMRKDHGAKLRRVVYKIILQRYTSLWIDLSDVSVFMGYLGMDQIFTDNPTGSKQMACIFCHFGPFSLLPVGRSVNIWSIPRCAVKTEMSLRSIRYEVYFCNIILQTTLPSSTSFKISFLIDYHWGLQSEFFDTIVFVRIIWSSYRVYQWRWPRSMLINLFLG